MLTRLAADQPALRFYLWRWVATKSDNKRGRYGQKSNYDLKHRMAFSQQQLLAKSIHAQKLFVKNTQHWISDSSTHCLLAETTSQAERQTAEWPWPAHQPSLGPLRDEIIKKWRNSNNNSTNVHTAIRGFSRYGDYGTWAAWLSFDRQRVQSVWWLWDMGCMTVLRFQAGTQTVVSPPHPNALQAHKAPQSAALPTFVNTSNNHSELELTAIDN